MERLAFDNRRICNKMNGRYDGYSCSFVYKFGGRRKMSFHLMVSLFPIHYEVSHWLGMSGGIRVTGGVGERGRYKIGV